MPCRTLALIATGVFTLGIAPGAILTINGDNIDLPAPTVDPGGGLSYNIRGMSTDEWRARYIELVSLPYRFLNLAFEIANLTNSPLEFTVFVSAPYIGGPYDRMMVSHNNGVIDDSSGSVTVTPGTGGPNIFTPILNGADLSAAGLDPNGCVFIPVQPDQIGACFSGAERHGIAAPASGTLAMRVNYVISPLDTFQTLSSVETVSSHASHTGTKDLCTGARGLSRSRVAAST